ncbi:GrpB family protein [Spiractinospora alimapuensis]|uniref:GrpB family protein n=1 Tax=Spiractinospora alimapuensis TaxID=2820884 RepID=UPI001F3BED0C|nr:GrpB family protein [Spiractinospora alimapuensis]QVQ53614.1 GrpB family protein [Spiractinospora alimapuensis]
MDPDRVRELRGVLIGGLERSEFVVVDYDTGWPTLAAEWMGRVRERLGDTALSIEHIGSTSVPGLAAKPIIDLLLVVADLETEDAYVEPLTAAGLHLRVREPGHRMLRTAERDVHLHVLPPDAQQERDYLALRDWLRVSPEDRKLYASTKRRLAERSWTDMNFYADAKTDTVLAILGRAHAWRARQ